MKLSTEPVGEQQTSVRIFKEKAFWIGALIGFAFYQHTLLAGWVSYYTGIAPASWLIRHRKFIAGYFKQPLGGTSVVLEVEASPKITVPAFVISVIAILALPLVVGVPFHVALLMLILLAIWTLGWIQLVGHSSYAIPRISGTYTKYLLSDALGGIGGTPAVSTAILVDQTFGHGLPWGNPGPLYQFACRAGYDLRLKPKDVFVGACMGKEEEKT